MTEKKINPFLKMVLELGPIVLFFVVFGRLKDQTFEIAGGSYSGFIVTTAIFIGLIMVTTGILWALTGKLSRMQLMTLILVIVMGGLSVWLNDERFIKMKPTLLYAAFAVILGIGLLQGKSYLSAVMEGVIPMTAEGWMILTKRMTAFFVVLAVANELVWRLMSTEAWVNFKTFGLTAALFVFIMTQGKLFETYSSEPTEKE
ncbi:inner membrane-spanning protein YciB [Xinfangfangia sp. CPCC 101601]|uniref:Inner membrane-spanning protein YciB n=1 Tax=Pseudogemmobacter lacusdianii TaxID=3069608 RepID=A0ABU0VVR9_9RHOB|nr:inner membrane-spanning protein YciB [Xinfangfangia sp. CPCC 101601]MDQ2065841.1 inner membrane-spanning protein YciB [Xinfangfangia sp. CPCC 101601]